MTTRIRTTALALLIAASATLALAPVSVAHHVHHVPTTDNGCSLYVSTPNPCDPDSAN